MAAALMALQAFSAGRLRAEDLKLAVIGDLPKGKSLETLAVHVALDAHAAKAGRGRRKIKLAIFPTQGQPDVAVQAAESACSDPSVMGLLAIGEEAADPRVLELAGRADMATVMASSWASPRPLSNGATWLSPTQGQLAEAAAAYARKGVKASQAAVLDNGSDSSNAAVKAFSRRFKELGGRVDFEGEWQGSQWGLTRTVKALKANWPQLVFFAGGGKEAGRLVTAMRRERELNGAMLIGLPTLFDEGFFEAGSLDTRHSSAVFPAPDYRGMALFQRSTGLAFPRSSPNFRAYVSYAYRKPGRWPAMVFDAAELLLSAMASADETQAGGLRRAAVHDALSRISGYRGIRGEVKFGPDHAPADGKAEVFYALPKVNSKEMKWYDKEFGPPFR